jgi:hypothetical protein
MVVVDEIRKHLGKTLWDAYCLSISFYSWFSIIIDSLKGLNPDLQIVHFYFSLLSNIIRQN